MLKQFIAVCVALIFATAASAVQITFTHQTLDASGTIDGQVFGTSQVTITAVGDTDNIESFGSGFFIDHAMAQIDIEGVGTFNFLSATRTFVNNNSQIVGFSRGGINGADLLNGPSDAAFGAWDMLSDIFAGGTLSYLQWGNSPVETDGGTLFFNSGSVSGRFSAVLGEAPIVPLPAAGWMLIAGLGGLGLMRRKR